MDAQQWKKASKPERAQALERLGEGDAPMPRHLAALDFEELPASTLKRWTPEPVKAAKKTTKKAAKKTTKKAAKKVA